MAKKAAPPPPTPTDQLREPAEVRYADQLEALRQNDPDDKPPPGSSRPAPSCSTSSAAEAPEGHPRRRQGRRPHHPQVLRRRRPRRARHRHPGLGRALLLVGEPGTGKSWLSEHLAAAISGNSTLTVQGTAGTTEEHIRYSWNIARVIAEGPTPANLIPSPTLVAMRTGALMRFEEITRCVPDVQDGLVSLLSDKAIAVPELPDAPMIWARPGFNVIATANTRDQGVNELSAALKRRFNYIYLPVVGDRNTEIEIVRERSRDLMARYQVPARIEEPVLALLATVFREIREGRTADGVQIQKPTTALSTAEAIAVALDAAIAARFFGSGTVGPEEIARNLVGSVVKEDRNDLKVLEEYLGIVAKKRAGADPLWKAFHTAAVRAVASA
ncbi:MAG: AAA family ATPase [Myxococcota bacterium]